MSTEDFVMVFKCIFVYALYGKYYDNKIWWNFLYQVHQIWAIETKFQIYSLKRIENPTLYIYTLHVAYVVYFSFSNISFCIFETSMGRKNYLLTERLISKLDLI